MFIFVSNYCVSDEFKALTVKEIDFRGLYTALINMFVSNDTTCNGYNQTGLNVFSMLIKTRDLRYGLSQGFI